MKVLFRPYVSSNKLVYEFDGDVIKAKMRVYLGDNCESTPMYYPEEDTFDFSQYPEGEALEIETDLPMCPILEARKIDGELQLVLVKFIDRMPATRDLYPRWLQIG